MKIYRHIIWDWNGTLIDDARLLKDIVNGLLIRCGKDPLPDETHQELFEIPVVNYYIRMGFDFTVYPFEQICIDFRDEYYSRVKECRLRKGAIDANLGSILLLNMHKYINNGQEFLFL